MVVMVGYDAGDVEEDGGWTGLLSICVFRA